MEITGQAEQLTEGTGSFCGRIISCLKTVLPEELFQMWVILLIVFMLVLAGWFTYDLFSMVGYW